MILDYPTLRVIWWLLLGVLLGGFLIMDGFDFGVAALLPILGKSDEERRIIINTVGPVWEGNQVWLILGAGAIFAAWPTIYAVSFSAFYPAMLIVLSMLILRPVAFKYRSKSNSTCWRKTWDFCLTLGGWVAPLIFGVAVGNTFYGVSFHFDHDMHLFYSGNLFTLLKPFALWVGVTTALVAALQGGVYLSAKTEGELQSRAQRTALKLALLTLLTYVIGGIWLHHLSGFVVTTPLDPAAASSPWHKEVVRMAGAWWQHYLEHPILLAIPGLGCFCLALTAWVVKRCAKGAMITSSAAIACMVGSVGCSLFPFILPSSQLPAHSLLVWDASSSAQTLWIMLIAAVIFVPIILTYTAWTYRVMRGKVSWETLKSGHHTY